ncbi:hypothetical protein PYCC9005_004555 [Savitreella phatthalungensis]
MTADRTSTSPPSPPNAPLEPLANGSHAHKRNPSAEMHNLVTTGLNDTHPPGSSATTLSKGMTPSSAGSSSNYRNMSSGTTPAGPRSSKSPARISRSPIPGKVGTSPRLSISSQSSIFERSVDNVAVLTTGAAPIDASGSAVADASQASELVPVIDAAHAQLVVDNQIPAALDASVQAIVQNEDLDKIEIVTAQPTQATLIAAATAALPPTHSIVSAATSQENLAQVVESPGLPRSLSPSGVSPSNSPSTHAALSNAIAANASMHRPTASLAALSMQEPSIPNVEENITVAGERGAELPDNFGMEKRISFISFADLVGVEQRELAELNSQQPQHLRSRSRESLGPLLNHSSGAVSPKQAPTIDQVRSGASSPLAVTADLAVVPQPGLTPAALQSHLRKVGAQPRSSSISLGAGISGSGKPDIGPTVPEAVIGDTSATRALGGDSPAGSRRPSAVAKSPLTSRSGFSNEALPMTNNAVLGMSNDFGQMDLELHRASMSSHIHRPLAAGLSPAVLASSAISSPNPAIVGCGDAAHGSWS